MAQDTPGVELLISEMASAIRRAYDEGYRRGSLEAVEKMTRAVTPSIAGANLPAIQPHHALSPQSGRRSRMFSYGTVINMFRRALIKAHDTGLSRQQLVEYCRMSGAEITVNQYRETIKRMTGGDEAVRMHGVYFPGPKIRGDLVPPDEDGPPLPSEIIGPDHRPHLNGDDG
jgi:hypothetical protein